MRSELAYLSRTLTLFRVAVDHHAHTNFVKRGPNCILVACNDTSIQRESQGFYACLIAHNRFYVGITQR